MTDSERAEIALAKIAKDAWAASKPLATGTAEQRKNERWRAVVRAVRAEVLAASKKIAPEDCPGHVASQLDVKICAICGIHVDELRPDESRDGLGHGL